MKTVKTLTLVCILMLTGVFASCSSDDDNNTPVPTGITNANALRTYLEQVASTTEAPGFSVSIGVGNQMVFHESFGYANIADQVPYTNNTVNSIASLSKTFVGAAVAKAIEQGHFTLETPINDVLPIAIINPKRPEAIIRIKHLVTHTSGIVDVPATYLASNYFILPGEDTTSAAASIMINDLGMQQMDAVDLEDYLEEIFSTSGELYNLDNYLDANPGNVWSYSNDATSLMGYIIEYVSGQSFDDYVATYILTPLQMNQSTFDIYDVNLQEMATQYMSPSEAFPRYGNHGYVEGSLHTTSNDMSMYLLEMLKGVRGESSLLFANNYYELLFSEQLADGIVPSGFAENHGLFWYMKNGNLMHGGNSLGCSSHMQLQQDGSSGFCIISNMDATFTQNTAKWEAVKAQISQAIEQFIQSQS